MLTTIGLVIVLAAMMAVVAVTRRYPLVARPLRRALSVVARGLGFCARHASRAADVLLARRRGGISAWRLALFTVVGALPLAAALAIPHVQPLAEYVDPGGLIAIGFLFALFVLLAAALIAREDYDVMDGLVSETERRFGGARTAARPAVVAVAIALFVAYIAAFAWWLDAVHGVALVARAPDTGIAPLSYLLIALRALPTDRLLSLLDRLTGDDTRVVIGPALLPAVYFFLVRAAGVAIVIGLVIVGVEHVRQVRRFLAELEVSDAYRPELMARGQRAPRAIGRAVLNAATVPRGGGAAQERLIAAAVELGLRDFPAMFCARLPRFTPAMQNLGLDRSIEMFRYRTREFDGDDALALFAAAADVFVAGKLDLEPTKKLTRLMASVVIFKKDVLKIPANQRAAVMNAAKIELAGPRAREDAALRGILRDLQSALGGEPIVVKPIPPVERVADDWIKPAVLPPAGRAVQPETPSTTVH